MASYDRIPGLEAVYLEDSFVLTVCVQPREVDLVVEAVLREVHPQYSDPKEGEQYCYRRGRLRFLEVRHVNWRMGGARAAYDATGELDWGGFDQFEVNSNRYIIVGDFGALEIEALKCEFVLEE